MPGTAEHCFFPDPTEDAWPNWLASTAEYFHFMVELVDGPGVYGNCCKDGGGILDAIDAGGKDGGGMSWPSDGGA